VIQAEDGLEGIVDEEAVEEQVAIERGIARD
jgi:hypothetical protein